MRRGIKIQDRLAWIELTDGQWAKVDIEDLAVVSIHTWRAESKKDGEGFIAVTGRAGMLMHTVVLGIKHRSKVVHINGDGLDNRRSNLKVVPQLEFNPDDSYQHKYARRKKKLGKGVREANANSKLGIRGVSVFKSKSGNRYVFRCMCKECRMYKSTFKYFSYTEEGLQEAITYSKEHYLLTHGQDIYR